MSKAILIEAKRLANDLTGTTELADYVSTLRPGQKKRIAGFVLKHGFHQSCQALYVNPAELEQCMVDSGHGQCEVCEDWFLSTELINSMCAGCTEEMA